MVQNQNFDRIESSADISLSVSLPAGVAEDEDADEGRSLPEIPISTLDMTKEVDVSQIRESTLKANGYSVNSISYDGSMTFAGHKVRSPNGNEYELDDVLFDDEGVPRPCTITILHETDGSTDTLKDVLATTKSYEVGEESETETSYDFVAMDKE